MIKLTGLRNWIIAILFLIGVIIILAITLAFFVSILPFILILIVIGFLVSLFTWKKRKKTSYVVDVKHKVKK